MKYELTASFHKGTCSSAHLGHNRRTIYVPHADQDRKHLNICYVDMSLEEAYHFLFDDALKEYNSTRKPSRQIKDYLAHIQEQYEKGEKKLQEARSRGASKKEQALIKSRYPKPFYEVIVSIGNRDSYKGIFRSGGEKEQITADILNEYMRDFQKRNPQLFVFSCFQHRDESGVNHIHLDYIPWTDSPGRGLPKRVSENGAFKQQGLTTGAYGDIGSANFQSQERQELEKIAKKYDIKIVPGKHSKQHLSKEEYILKQEQEKSKDDHNLINQQAEELIAYQDELADYIKQNGMEEAFSEHIENISLKQEKVEWESEKQKNKKILADSWQRFNDFTSNYFEEYKQNKALLWEELSQARKRQSNNKKRIAMLLYDIEEGSDLLIIKLFKLIAVMLISIGNFKYDNQVEKLQEANRLLKKQAKEIMKQSADVSAELRKQDVVEIENAMLEYEKRLAGSIDLIHTIMQEQHYQNTETIYR